MRPFYMKRSGLIQAAAVAIAWALTATSGAAFADDERKTTPAERAHALYDISATAYEAGRFQEAVDLLLRAYEITPKPVLLFNLARAYEGLGQWAKAVDAYEAYLKAEPKAADQGSIERRIAQLRKDLADRAALQKERDEAARRAERDRIIAIEQRKIAEAAEAARRRGPLPWVVASVGGAGLLAGGILSAVALKLYHDGQATAYIGPARQDLTDARGFARAGDVGFIAGGILAATGVTWGIIQLTRGPATPERNKTICVRVAPGSLALVGSY
jgi:tetratricopeptide (TPR) repeat protein